MLSVLFWNVRGHNLSSPVAGMAALRNVDLVVLAERKKNHSYTGDLAAATGKPFVVFKIPGCLYLHVLSSVPKPQLDIVEADKRYAILRVDRPPKPDILLALTHLPPKGPGANSLDNQRSVAEDLHQRIQFQEGFFGHSRTVVVGDLNMDPFETGMTSSKGFHAVMAREVAARRSRRINRKTSSPIFFNPIWHYWGDKIQRPPGTYYKGCSLTDCLFWHMFDQVLVRDAVGPQFDYNSLQILQSDGVNHFCSAKALPNKAVYSDHLPLVFELDV